MPHTATRYHDISCGHTVTGHESKCAHLHGHNYRIHFTCETDPGGRQPNGSGLDVVGRVIDFSAIKAHLCMWVEREWDHKFLVWNADPRLWPLKEIDVVGVVAVPFNPTAENMAEYLVHEVGPAQLRGTGVRLVRVVVEETAKCSAAYGVAR